MTTFPDFGLNAAILDAVAAEGYATPTPIQAKAIPHVVAGRDVLGIAQTGTGKTAAFALPVLHRLAAAPKRPLPASCRVLVLAPTRELASQIADGFRTYGRNLRLKVSVIFGGVSEGRQKAELRPGVDVLVATPGRLLDLVDQKALSLSQVEVLVLDEADQMLDLGFIHALKRVAALVPAKRQTLFFSATMPKAIEGLAAKYLTDPVPVAVAPAATTAEKVAQSVMHVVGARKQALLRAVLRDEAIDRVLVFSRTKHGADRIVEGLSKAGIHAAAIHGNKSQPQRERALGAFREGSCRVLVATDIAARGIDVEGVSHVVNFDLPNVPEQYVHRIGRTARAGASGSALSFCAPDERAYLRDIEKVANMKVPVADLPEGFESAAGEPEAAPERTGRNQPRRDGRNGPAREARPARGGNREGQRRDARPPAKPEPRREESRPARRERPERERHAPAAAPAAALAPVRAGDQASGPRGTVKVSAQAAGLPAFMFRAPSSRI